MRNKVLFFLLYQILFLLWCVKLHRHFFEFTHADRFGLVIVSLLPLLILKLRPKREARFLWMVCVLSPIAIFPLIDYGLRSFSDAWILLYILPFVTGLAIVISKSSISFLFGLLSAFSVWFVPYSFQTNQKKYYDLLSETIATRKGETDVVTWKGEQWMYYNGSLISSSVDGHMHAETLVHTTLSQFENPSVLLLGDDFGLTRTECSKYACELTHVPYDQEVFQKMDISNEKAIVVQGILEYVESENTLFEVILIDLPDPEHLTFQHFYEAYFYRKCLDRLTPNGILMTNAGGYYTNEKFYKTIDDILKNENLKTTVLQALIPTLGHRTWVMASNQEITLEDLSLDTPTLWINQDAIQLMQFTGKDAYPF